VTQLTADELLLRSAYAAYNAQDLVGLLSVVNEDVDWPGGPRTPRRLRGHIAVRAYWTEQWSQTRTHDEPVSFSWPHDGRDADADGGRGVKAAPGAHRIAVRIDQVVRALDGSVLGTGVYDHVHQVKDGRIVRMDIYPTAGAQLGQ